MNTESKARLDLIFGRRSIRTYGPGEVSEQQIETVLQAAMAAPSAVAKDPWRFVVVRDKTMLRQIAEKLPNGKMLADCAVGLVVCGDIDVAHDRQLSYLLQDCSAAIENALLAIHILGLGACWLGVHPREDRVQHLQKVLALPASVLPICAIAIGRPGETKPARTRYNPGYVHFERW